MNRCKICSEIKETQPYGKNCEEICFQCAMLPENKERVLRQLIIEHQLSIV